MRGPFGETFLASPPFARIVPLEVPRGYRDAAEGDREVVLLRYVACAPCGGRGCKRCASVGWSVERFTAHVAVPRGATPGTRVVVPGASHVVRGNARDLIVEIAEPGPRAEQLAADAGDHEEKLVMAWQMDEALHRRTMKKLKVGIAIAASFAALACGVHWGAYRTHRVDNPGCLPSTHAATPP